MMEANKEIAKQLLAIQAVSLKPNDPFTWASGIQAPIYCDNRLTLSHPKLRTFIADQFNELIGAKFPEADVVAGTATAGIPHAALVAERLELPMIYVRGKAKAHGKGNQIEGQLLAGQKVVIVEDLVSTGGSSLQAAKVVADAGGKVLGIVAIFSYGLDAAINNMESENVPLYTLTDFQTLLDVSQSEGTLSKREYEKLVRWQLAPSDWQT
ncbi:orotate phosphoribosyltransferase [Geomicrobium sp. JCM 19039]|nr:orotate phosphoribosyltransferase [Geomicrobium sp. JCM 19039]